MATFLSIILLLTTLLQTHCAVTLWENKLESSNDRSGMGESGDISRLCPLLQNYCPGANSILTDCCVSVGAGGKLSIKNAVSTIGYHHITLNFGMNCDNIESGEVFKVYYSIKDSYQYWANFTEVASYTTESETWPSFELPETVNNDIGIRILWYLDGSGSNDQCHLNGASLEGILITESPTSTPTNSPTQPTSNPTYIPTFEPTLNPSKSPTGLTSNPTTSPTPAPTDNPTTSPTQPPTANPTPAPTYFPTPAPTINPTPAPTDQPTTPSSPPTSDPTSDPTTHPTKYPSTDPTIYPTEYPSKSPTTDPTYIPTINPTNIPTINPTEIPTIYPTHDPTHEPTFVPTKGPTYEPTHEPTNNPTKIPTTHPSYNPSHDPTNTPTKHPTIPTYIPTYVPTDEPTIEPTSYPLSYFEYNIPRNHREYPTHAPIYATKYPSFTPTHLTNNPTIIPTREPTPNPIFAFIVADEVECFTTLYLATVNTSDAIKKINLLNFGNDNGTVTFVPCLRWTAASFQHTSYSHISHTHLFNDTNDLFYGNLECEFDNSQCIIICESRISCFHSKMVLNASNISQINCIIDAACFQSNIYISSSKLSSILCFKKGSCASSTFYVNNVQNFTLECVSEESCKEISINITNTTEATIICYDQHSCDFMTIWSDNKNIHFKLHAYNKQLSITVPSSFSFNNINCDPHHAYLRLDGDSFNYSFEDSVSNLFNGPPPCQDVEFNFFDSHAVPCRMVYQYAQNHHSLEYFRDYMTCYPAIFISEIANVSCFGTLSPTIDPSSAPTEDPTYDPSSTPTEDPTHEPTNNPTKIPTTHPSYNPSHDPSSTPTVSPSQPPTIAPTISPTFSPTQNPTDSGIFGEEWINIIYDIKNLSNHQMETLTTNITDTLHHIQIFIEESYVYAA
eukprot:31807_1